MAGGDGRLARLDPGLAPPGGESFATVASGSAVRWPSCSATYPGETVVVVSHVSPIKLMLRDALAASDAFLHRLYLDPAGISVVDIVAGRRHGGADVNDTAHL